MTPIEAFIRARLWSDECHARNAFGDHNNAGPEWTEQWSGALNIGDGEDLVMTNDSQVSRFMERFDPARVLADVEAKRRLIKLAGDATALDLAVASTLLGAKTDDGSLLGEDILRTLAFPYANHPDFDERWRDTPSTSHTE